MKRFLWWLAGANIFILDQCPIDQNKHTKIGIAILMTGIIAGITGGFAIYSSFDSGLLVGLMFGIVWCIVIINLDSLIVASIKTNGSFKEKILSASIRIILSIFIGLVISHPLELFLFKDEIQKKVKATIIENKNQPNENRIAQLVSDLEEKKIRRDTLEERKKINEQEMKCLSELMTFETNAIEITTDCGATSGKFGVGENHKKLQERYNNLRSRDDSLASWLSSLYVEIRLAEQEKLKLEKLITGNFYQDASSSDRISLLTAHNAYMALIKDENGKDVLWLSIFITLLIIFIELSPVIVKLMQPSGRYEELVQSLEDKKSDRDQYITTLENYPQFQIQELANTTKGIYHKNKIYEKLLKEEKNVEEIRFRHRLNLLKLENDSYLEEVQEFKRYKLEEQKIELEFEKQKEILESSYNKEELTIKLDDNEMTIIDPINSQPEIPENGEENLQILSHMSMGILKSEQQKNMIVPKSEPSPLPVTQLNFSINSIEKKNEQESIMEIDQNGNQARQENDFTQTIKNKPKIDWNEMLDKLKFIKAA